MFEDVSKVFGQTVLRVKWKYKEGWCDEGYFDLESYMMWTLEKDNLNKTVGDCIKDMVEDWCNLEGKIETVLEAEWGCIEGIDWAFGKFRGSKKVREEWSKE